MFRSVIAKTGAALLLASLAAGPLHAQQWQVNGATVTVVEGTYMPLRVAYQVDRVDTVGSPCAGAWLSWAGQGSTAQEREANVEAVYALLLLAKATNIKVNLLGQVQTTNPKCTTDFIHLQ